MEFSSTLVIQSMAVCSSLIGSFPSESIVLNSQLVFEMKNLFNLLEGSLKNVASKSVQPISQPGFDALDSEESIGLLSSRPNYVPQRSMTFLNSKYKKCHQTKMFPESTSSSQNCVSKSSVIPEPESLVPSYSYIPSKSSVVTNSDISDVPGKVAQVYTSGTEPESEDFIHGGNVVCTGKSKTTASSVSEEETSYIETNLPRKFPDPYNRSAPFSNSSDIAPGYLSTSSEESICESRFPSPFPDMFETLESSHKKRNCEVLLTAGLSEPYQLPLNKSSTRKSSNVRTETLVDFSETSLRDILSYVPPPLEEVLLNLKNLCAKGSGNS